MNVLHLPIGQGCWLDAKAHRVRTEAFFDVDMQLKVEQLDYKETHGLAS